MSKRCIDLSTIIASLTHRLSLSLLMVACLATPSWGQVKVAEIVGNPIVNDDKITIRIKVKGEEGRPIVGLQDTDFKLVVDGQETTFNSKDWKSPEESVPPPAWIIVLLDFSGSMNQQDSQGMKKLDGAINAIREFNKMLTERSGNTQIVVVPFGEPSPRCIRGYPVDKETINKFLSARDPNLKEDLEKLAHSNSCASTNLYEPLKQAVKFFANSKDKPFYVPENSSEPQPRLSIILLSDGYHNAPNEEQEFQNLKTLLKRNNQITVHTLGYGKTPEELGKEYLDGRPATRADIGIGQGKVPEEQFVDKQRLAEIAKLTGGIAEFSGNAEEIAQNLEVFLNALLGEYEITYTQPNAERASKHDVRVVVKSTKRAAITSAPKGYTITVFGRSLPFPIRITMLLCVLLVLGLGGVVPFYIWGQYLKKEAFKD